jgi:hypothetical protein
MEKYRGPTPWNMGSSPETRAVRVPPFETNAAEREPGDLKAPWEDAVGEGNVEELAEDVDGEDIRALEIDAQRGVPRVDWRG